MRGALALVGCPPFAWPKSRVGSLLPRALRGGFACTVVSRHLAEAADAVRGEAAIVGGTLAGHLSPGEAIADLRHALPVGRIIILLGALDGATRESGPQVADQAVFDQVRGGVPSQDTLAVLGLSRCVCSNTIRCNGVPRRTSPSGGALQSCQRTDPWESAMAAATPR